MIKYTLNVQPYTLFSFVLRSSYFVLIYVVNDFK
jgi:hypothetical protein